MNGPLTPDQKLRHLCPIVENPLCVRLDHLKVGTSKDNANDRKLYGKPNRHRARLTSDEIAHMEELYTNGMTQQRIAGLFNIAMSTAEKYLCPLPGLRSRKKKEAQIAA